MGAKNRWFVKAAALPFVFFLSLACETSSDGDDDLNVNRKPAEVPIMKIETCIAEYDRCTAPANAQYAQCLMSGAGWVACGATLDTAVAPCATAIETCLNGT